jgi:hypothetical protein
MIDTEGEQAHAGISESMGDFAVSRFGVKNSRTKSFYHSPPLHRRRLPAPGDGTGKVLKNEFFSILL